MLRSPQTKTLSIFSFFFSFFILTTQTPLSLSSNNKTLSLFFRSHRMHKTQHISIFFTNYGGRETVPRRVLSLSDVSFSFVLEKRKKKKTHFRDTKQRAAFLLFLFFFFFRASHPFSPFFLKMSMPLPLSPTSTVYYVPPICLFFRFDPLYFPPFSLFFDVR